MATAQPDKMPAKKTAPATTEPEKQGGGSGWAIVPVMYAFFVMGFVDLIGTAKNYVQAEFSLTDSNANLLTSMVFFWFLIFSVPAGILMNKIGRRKTVLLSIIITSFAMLLPVLAYTVISGSTTPRLVLLVIGFALLGIGNCFMQVSLNPLLTVFVKGDRLASTLTTGQFVKAFASLFAPYIASWASRAFGKWWLLFAIYLVIGIIGYLLLQFDDIEEPKPEDNTTTIGACFRMLGDPVILLCFLGIVSHVGVDAGINGQAPKILMGYTDTVLETATYATMVYFVARMIGCLTGSFVLSRISNKTGLVSCGIIMVLSAVCYVLFAALPGNPVPLFWVATALVGFGNSNVFSLFLSQALTVEPAHQNEVSGLMMMGLIGGAIFPPLMGAAADSMGQQVGSVLVMAVGCVYVLVIGLMHQVIERKPAA